MSIIAPDFCGHWKTVMLEQLTGEPNALAYVVRLFCHCHARMEDCFEMSTKELAALCHYPILDAAKLEKALIECRWIERKKKHLTIIGWKEHNPGLFANRENGKKGGRPKKEKPMGHPPQTHGQPTENPLQTNGYPIANPRDTDGIPTGNPPLTDGQPKQNREERRGEDITPIVPLQGTCDGLESVVQFAIERLCTLFGRKKKNVGAGARYALESLAMNGVLPLPSEDWTALEAFYEQRSEHPGENMWRSSPERIADDLQAEIDKAKSWLSTHDLEFGVEKKEEAGDPHLWGEFLEAAGYPATPFAQVDAGVMREFRTWREKVVGGKAA